MRNSEKIQAINSPMPETQKKHADLFDWGNKDLAYNLDFPDSELVKNMIASVSTDNLKQSLTRVDQLYTLMRNASREGLLEAVNQIKKVFEFIKDRQKSPIIHYAVELANERLAMQTIIRASILSVDYPHPESISALEQVQDEQELEHIRLSKQINPDTAIPTGGKIYRIASDAVAIFDRTNIAQALGKVKIEDLPEPQEPSLAGVRNVRRMLAAGEFEGGFGLGDLIQYLLKLNITRYFPIDFGKHINNKEYLDGLLKDLEVRLSAQLPLVRFEPYESLEKNNEINPFSKDSVEHWNLMLQFLHRPELRKKIETDLNLNLGQLPLRSQVHFLRFLAGQDQAGFARLRSVLHSRPDQANNILNSFLACAEDVDYGQAILNISEKADTALSGEIFKKYNEIVNLGEEVRNNLDDYFGPQSGIIDVNVLVRSLLQKANSLLVDYSQQLNQANQANQQELVASLASVQSEVLVFASGIKAAIKGERVNWRNIPGVKEEEKESAELTPSQKAIMLQIFKANREKTYPPKLFAHTVEDFENTINQPGHTFRLLYHNNSLLAFFHYDENVKDKEIYVGSLNLNPNATDTPIAVSMVFEALNEKPDYKLNAVVWAKNPARMFYTKFLGFKKVGEIANYHNTGEKYWELVRPAKAEQVELPKAA